MAAGFEMRVSDAEREAAAAELREHFASGRLTQDELNERLDAAFAARTRGDLGALFADLPSARPGEAAAGARAGSGAGAGEGPSGQYHGRPGSYRRRQGSRSWGPGPGIGAFAAMLFAVPVLMLLGIASIAGIGAGRPLGIMLIFAAIAVLRRLLLVIFGRRRGRGCGPRRRRW